MLALDVERGVLAPDLQDDVQRFHGDAVALDHVLVAEKLPVAHQAARSDAEQQAPAAQLIEQRRFRRYHHRVVMGQVDDPRAEADVLGGVDQRCQEHQG